MAITYENFTAYPIQILGLNESSNKKLQAIETFVKFDLNYSGDAVDLTNILPYFVFFAFCDDKTSSVTQDGETVAVSDLTKPSVHSQVRAWSIGAKMLDDICKEKETTCNENYRSQRMLLW